MENFTPYSALAGGIFIGISATLLLLFNGRIAGISGMMSGLFNATYKELFSRGFFLIGIMIGAYLCDKIKPDLYQPRESFSLLLLAFGGILVGFGTRMGNGCTSGHAVCGIARFSVRSTVATLIFMTSGFVTVFVIRHLLGIAA